MKYLEGLKALADPTRFKLLNLLRESQLNVAEMVQLMDMGQSRISRHLKILLDAGLITLTKEGLWSYYALARDSENARLLSRLDYLFLEDAGLVKQRARVVRISQERRQKTRQFFDSIASDWGSLKNELFDEEQVSCKILSYIKPARSAADLGCGNGDLLPLLSKSSEKVIGVDQSPSMMEKARGLAGENTAIELRLGELEHLPLRDGEVEAVVMKMVLHHLPHPEVGILEASRILKPRGKLVIFEFLPHQRVEMQERYGDTWLGFSGEQIKSWIKKAGMKCELSHEMGLKKDIHAAFYVAVKSI
ncbi:MAG: metalloregulator ArsR/SmtB family transcription factor [Spirochaetales bacterium]|nr:metalloregulator ArsR/SmtB family transcription factor [Spirochaetales bacterium]